MLLLFCASTVRRATRACVVKDTVLVVLDFAEELWRQRLEALVAQAVVDDRLSVLLRQALLPDRVRPGRREGTC